MTWKKNEECTLENLPSTALESICSRIGLDLEMHVFPYLFEEEEEEREESPAVTSYTKRDRSHADYVLAAKECLSIEEETERMMTEDPEAMAELERAMLAEDPALLAEIVADVLAKSPDLVAELEVELAKEDPELFAELMKELSEGQTLADRPEILAELVALMLADDPDMLDKLDEEVAAHILGDLDGDYDDYYGEGAEL
uniref:Uncharacterized protein n=1 Tax=Ditylum brightwellii TaxID=49249 RepID=A0A7S4QYN0_9STRA